MNLKERIKIALASPKTALNWIRALDLSSEGCFKEALRLLQENEPMSAGSDVEYHLLRGFVYWRVEDYASAIEEAKGVIRLIPAKKRYNDEEKKYLHAYAQITWARALSGQGKESESMCIVSQCDIPAIDLDRVSNAIKRHFPLQEHPDWREP